MEESSTKGDVLQRIAGVSFIVGGILLLVLNALFPRADDPSDTQQVLTELADNETFVLVIFMGLAVGAWALMIGVVGVYRSITTGGAAAWVRLGFYGVTVGTTLFTAAIAVGIATTGAAVEQGGTELGTAAYIVAVALNAIGNSLFYMSVIVLWLALAFLAIGIILSTVYPKWLGWPLLILGAATVVVGFILSLSDPTQALDYTFGVLAGLTTVWAIAIGVIITRRQIKLM